jgi:TrmH family RNA methyltransferase
MDRLRPISSSQNATIKDLRRTFSRGELLPDGYYGIEGVKAIEEATRSGVRFRALIFSKSGERHSERLLNQVSAKAEGLLVSDEIFASSVGTESPQGVAALVSARQFTIDDLFRRPSPLILVAAGIQDPGNLGTIIRSAEAFDSAGVVLGEGTVSRFNAKAVRASAGSIFRLPLVEMPLRDALIQLRERGVRVLATSSHKGTPLQEAGLTGSVAIIVGSEGAGLKREVLSTADELISIPHSSKVESLNVAIATSLILYESARQRHVPS